jgi:hypothetical protein
LQYSIGYATVNLLWRQKIGTATVFKIISDKGIRVRGIRVKPKEYILENK